MSEHMSLKDFEAVRSDDLVKTDLELTCLVCGTVVCDIEAGDNIGILASVVRDHAVDSHGEFPWQWGEGDA